MNCAVHSDQPATGYCRNCGKPMCPQCTREVQGALYCEPCLGNLLVGSQNAGVKPGTNPGLAAVLGLIPGLGAVYNGQYVKALIHVLIFGGLIAMESTDLPGGLSALFGVAIGCFYCYMPIEAYRTAKAHLLGTPEPVGITNIDSTAAKPIGAMVLIGLGVLLLLRNFDFLDREWFHRTWPIALIAVGVWLVWDRIKKPS
ncbi:MAG: B-box zinc finger protein [Candidatus Acidiferrales bacterium]